MIKLKKKCLILDHDDTLINSQETIHYPIFLETLRLLRPDEPEISFEDFVLLTNEYGFEGFIKNIYSFSEEEIAIEVSMWREKVNLKQAKPFEDVQRLVCDYFDHGGIVIVYSYSEAFMIEKDYDRLFGRLPHGIIGYDVPPHERKPARSGILKTIAQFDLSVKDCLLIDDMPMMIETAKRTNMDMVGACWAKGAKIQWKDLDVAVPLCEDASCLRSLIFY